MVSKPVMLVIRIDEEKCVNCYACIAACPVKYCMDDGSGEKLTVDPGRCIGCGLWAVTKNRICTGGPECLVSLYPVKK
jgi:ferredoxin